jgi:hypothetical protein
MTRCLILLLLMFISCSTTHKTSRPLKKDKTTGLPVAKRLNQLDTVDTALLRGRRGVMFRVTTMKDAELDDEAAPLADPCHSGTKNCHNAAFVGCDRKAAKLSFSDTTNHKEPLQHLIDRLLASEPTMMNHNPAISLASTSTRVAEETENVWLEHVFIYVIIHEDDGDYHLIIGDGQDTAGETLMNVEISGLPDSSSPYYNTLRTVRNNFESKYNMCSKKFFWETHSHSPLPEISVKGTLFFDLRHANSGGHAGNNTIKTKTFWEIHPATYIRFWN